MTPVEEAIAALEPMVAVRDYLAQFNLKDDWPFAGTLLVWADFRRAAQALSRLRADGEGWRPIEEAPRDGTKLLLWDEQGGMSVGEWFQSKMDTYEEEGVGGLFRKVVKDFGGFWTSDFAPTKFRPLPDPPRS